MEYCGPRGIPHSQFLKWSEDDQDKAIAWVIDQASKCGSCGSYPDEWTYHDGQGRPQRTLPPPMYVRSHKCEGCAILSETEDLVRSQYSGKLPAGMRFFLSRQPPAPIQETDG